VTQSADFFAHGSLWIGVHDALSARLVRDTTARAAWLSSYGVSASLRAQADASHVSSTEMLSVASHAARAADPTPLVVDCDTGYGDAQVWASVAEEYAASSTVAAVCIEDKLFPKRNTLDATGVENLDTPELMTAKLLAAARARDRRRPSLALIARSEALALGAGVEEALRRLHAYARAGADAVLVQSKGSEDELREVGRRWADASTVPIICVPTSYPTVPSKTWWQAGFSVVVRSHQLLQAAVAAQQQVLASLASADVPPDAYRERLADHEAIRQLVAPAS
jgi:phosphoenolpyruvate phosphomutase